MSTLSRRAGVDATAFTLAIATAVLVGSCGRITLPHTELDGGNDGGNDGGKVACHGLSQVQCGARPDCAIGTCSICGPDSMFVACYDPAVENHPPCPAIACAPCAQLDQASCAASPACRVDTCLGCNGPVFARCALPNDPPPLCPVYDCPAPPPCSQVTTRDACEARSDCHSVFVDPGTCGCAAIGCCAHFSACADGDRARCAIPVTLVCKSLTPYCESPAYVVSYTETCYEGCVQPKDCAP